MYLFFDWVMNDSFTVCQTKRAEIINFTICHKCRDVDFLECWLIVLYCLSDLQCRHVELLGNQSKLYIALRSVTVEMHYVKCRDVELMFGAPN